VRVLPASFLGKPIELARLRVAFDRCVELARVESLEPRAKSRQLARRQLLDGLSMSSVVKFLVFMDINLS
jgi:hypothetical protein